jgi:uncharacterized membrane protein
MQNNKLSDFDRQIRYGWLLLAAGILCLLIGAGLSVLVPGTLINTRVIVAFGILLSGIAVGLLARNITLKKHPEAAKRSIIAEQDERVQSIRQRAGNKTFELTSLVSCIALLVYSFASRGANEPASFDPLWFYLAFMFVAPMTVYWICMLRYQNRY